MYIYIIYIYNTSSFGAAKQKEVDQNTSLLHGGYLGGIGRSQLYAIFSHRKMDVFVRPNYPNDFLYGFV